MSFPSYGSRKYSGIEWFGEIPGHWTMTRLGRICSEINDVNHEMPKAVADGVPFLSAKDLLDDGTLNFDKDVKMISQEDYDRLSQKVRPQRDDIIYSRIGTLGKARLVNTDIPFLISYSCCVVRVARDAVCRKFVCHLLDGEMLLTEARMRTKGIGVPDLGLREISRFPIPLPPLEEQEAISSFLDAETAKIDALVAEQRRLIELLQEKRQAVISHAVTKGLNPDAPMKPSGIPWLGDVPSHWDVHAYRHLTSRVIVGIAEAATHAYAEEGVPIVRSTNIKTGKIDQSKMLYIKEEFAATLDSKALYTDDIVTTRTGANVGVSAVVPESLHMSQCFTLVISSPKPKVANPHFYNHFINSTPGKLYIDLTAWGSGQPNISVPIIQRMHTVKPPRDEQDEIVKYIERASGQQDGMIAEAERAIKLLQERRNALISAAVTGKIDVRGYGKEEAA